MKILALGASFRKDSYNKKLIGAAATLLRARADVSVDLPDFLEFRAPLFNEDEEKVSGVPAPIQELGKKIAANDGWVISTPEYNGSIPGTLKSTIDWVSRLDPHPLDGKPVLLLSATPGGLGGIRGLIHTRVPFQILGAHVYPETLGIARAHQAFGPDGKFVDPKNTEKLQELLNDFLSFTKKLSV